MLSPRDKVNNYEVIAPLGTGGMAQLYLARRRGVGGFTRLVTLKLVHEHLSANEDIIDLFLQEARLSAHIAHPNVVRVEEVGRCGSAYFIAMEYVHGVSLAELLLRLRHAGQSVTPAIYVWLAAQIAEALHAAHEARAENGTPLGIVHHDVSPQNVLVSESGHVKLIDFGIARSREQALPQPQPTAARLGAQRLRDDDTVRGKLRYMAPEQLLREPADRRADVYALGVILWEMLTCRSLLRCRRLDDDRDWATRMDPPAPSQHTQAIDQRLDRAVLKALASEPAERFADALQFRAALLDATPDASRLDAPAVAAILGPSLGAALTQQRQRAAERGQAGEAELTEPLPGDDTATQLPCALEGIALHDCPTRKHQAGLWLAREIRGHAAPGREPH